MQNDDNGVVKPFEDGLLLSSLVNFRPVIEQLLGVLEISSVCEIGIDRGLFSEWLIRHAREEGIRYMAVDPKVPVPVKSLLQADEYSDSKSIEFLKEMTSPYDLYVVDGDHNYFTVTNELQLIAEKALDGFPVCVLHDINWPWARRDFYYDISDIPVKHRQPATNEDAITIDNPGTSDVGYRPGGGTYFAQHEGGKRNGVRTAVEDFMAVFEEKNDRALELLKIPSFFGLGILYDPEMFSASQQKELEDIVRIQDHAKLLMKQLEHNRASLILEIVRLHGLLRQERAKNSRQ